MNMEQINMMMQWVVQQGQVSGSGAGKDSDRDSFQDLMAQKKDQASSNSAADSQKPKDPAAPTQEQDAVQQPQEDGQISDDVRQILAAMQMQPFVAQNLAVTPEVQEGAVLTAVPVQTIAAAQTVPTAAAPEVMTSAQPETMAQAAMQTAQPTVTAEQGQSAAEMTPVQPETQQPLVQTAAANAGQQETADTTAGERPMVQAEQTDGKQMDVVEQEQPVFRNVESVPVKVGENTPTVDMHAPDVKEQLADTVQASLKTVGDKVEIQLQPENLGRITIELTQQGGKLGLVIYADNAKSTSLLAQNMGGLSALLEDRTGQNVTIQVQQQEPEQPQYDGHNRQNQQQQQEQQSKPEQSNAEQSSFLGQLRLGLYPTETI